MKIEELRLGNWIAQKGNHFQITPDMFCHYLQHGLHSIEPIPLTEEWLLKAGFEKYLNGDYYRLKAEMCIEAWSDKFSVYLPYYHLDTYTGRISVKYVHTLQNLYFTLTETELPFTA
jgi:aryl carrier-like protein